MNKIKLSSARDLVSKISYIKPVYYEVVNNVPQPAVDDSAHVLLVNTSSVNSVSPSLVHLLSSQRRVVDFCLLALFQGEVYFRRCKVTKLPTQLCVARSAQLEGGKRDRALKPRGKRRG